MGISRALTPRKVGGPRPTGGSSVVVRTQASVIVPVAIYPRLCEARGIGESYPRRLAAEVKVMADKMTEVEIKAHCLIKTMGETGKYGKAEGEKACALCIDLAMEGKADKADVSRASGWLGNHSAVRQWGEKFGYVTKSEAGKDATAREYDRLMSLATEPPKGKK